MFDAAEAGHKLDHDAFKAAEPGLRQALLDLQYELKERADFPVIVLINGLDGAGKGETVNLLNEWMDPRLIATEAFGEPDAIERSHPAMWRYWQALPPRGRIGILFGSWYTEPIGRRVDGEIRQPRLDQQIDEIVRFERMLQREGALLVKFWFHLSRSAQKRRLNELQADPRTRWRVSAADWDNLERHDRIKRFAEHTLLKTSTADAPWWVVDGSDPDYRALFVAETLKRQIEHRLHERPAAAADAAPLQAPIDGRYLLDLLDLSQSMSREDYDAQLEKWQGRLALLSRHPRLRKRNVVVVFEGHDAAGKGGAIRRVASALDARLYRIHPIAAPAEEERAQPYLWRFWRRLPRRGHFAIFDRSWYGRVLVERVEGFCSEADWMRAYEEINDFERQLQSAGTILVKFWLAIDRDEQLRRFEEREETGFKRYKITAEDWRNRDKWDLYSAAIHDMVERTSSSDRPWTLVEANDKRFARIKVLRTLCRAMEAALEE
ncbi:polyphosphate:AMP phosphotransferase [Chitinimonas koreensis]|uniref:polyphosphate:AMP phosphotransferase n=1 Tax=Chitinimonas koreensis TaxID=356302 RepID=UPI000405DA93|nr:polyphosphate:AMP phosphotransferase [Chitinimonas koreensis]QNM97677.1 polyphosphate:AMP phosphotransferase [Chitinimonas koreensis]